MFLVFIFEIKYSKTQLVAETLFFCNFSFLCVYMQSKPRYIYIYSNLGVDRISDMFNPGFQNNSWIIFKTTSFTLFSSLLCLAIFGHGCGETTKNANILKK